MAYTLKNKPKAPVKLATKSEPAPVAAKKVRRAIIDNPQIGILTPEEFEAIGRAALGGHGWQKRFIAGSGLAQSTVTRYLRGVFPIPQYVAVMLEMIQTLRNNGLPLPEAFTSHNR